MRVDIGAVVDETAVAVQHLEQRRVEKTRGQDSWLLGACSRLSSLVAKRRAPPQLVSPQLLLLQRIEE